MLTAMIQSNSPRKIWIVHAVLRNTASRPRLLCTTLCFTPRSENIPSPTITVVAIAITPNMSGAKRRVISKLLPKRIEVLNAKPARLHIPAFNTRVLREICSETLIAYAGRRAISSSLMMCHMWLSDLPTIRIQHYANDNNTQSPQRLTKSFFEGRFAVSENVVLSFSALPNNEPASNQFQELSDEFGSCSTTPNATIIVKAARSSFS